MQSNNSAIVSSPTSTDKVHSRSKTICLKKWPVATVHFRVLLDFNRRTHLPGRITQEQNYESLCWVATIHSTNNVYCITTVCVSAVQLKAVKLTHSHFSSKKWQRNLTKITCIRIISVTTSKLLWLLLLRQFVIKINRLPLHGLTTQYTLVIINGHPILPQTRKH